MAKKGSKKEERKRRLLFLILLLVLTIAVGGTATYAWFTSNRTVTVDEMNVEVTAVNGLQISADARNWKAKVTKQELIDVGADTTGTYQGSTNQLPATFGNVSTAKAVSSGKLNMFYGNVEPNATSGEYELTSTGPLTEIKCDGTTNGCDGKYYYAFDLFFKVTGDTEVVLEPQSDGGSYVKNQTGQTDRGIQNTTRVAFVKEGHWDSTTAYGTMQAGAAGTSVLLWEPNCDSHTSTGIQNAADIYNITVTDGGQCVSNYYGVNSQFTTGVPLNDTNSARFTQITPDFKTVNGFDTAVDIFTGTNKLEAGVTKYRVYWWVEGQDVDTENNATNSFMTLQLKFSIKA